MASGFADILAGRARDEPDATAFVFEGEERVTYAELDARARTIAAGLADARGERVLLVYPPGVEYVAALFGCFYAGAVAVPAYPPDPARLERTLPRLEAIIRDAEPKVVLTIDVLTGLVGGNTLATDTLPPGSWSAPAAPGDVALLQYTSGSTADAARRDAHPRQPAAQLATSSGGRSATPSAAAASSGCRPTTTWA